MGSSEASRNTKNKIVRYYDDTFLDYFLVLRLWQHLGMHYGFYDQAKKQSLKDAILNMNRVVADKARVEPEMKVLDAGCGVGGSSIWLAKNRGAEVTGITLVENQRVKAEKLAKKYGVSNKTSFLVRDYFKTGFADNTFHVVWAIESACYAEDKGAFLREVKRILRPKGRLVIADFWQKKSKLSAWEKELMGKWLDGWAMPELSTINEFEGAIKEAGFHNVESDNVTDNIMPFSQWLYRRSVVAYPVAKILEWIRIRSKVGTGNVRASIFQNKTLNKDLWAYVIYTAQK